MLDCGFGDTRVASRQAKTTSVMDIAERRFAWLLNQRSYGFWSENELEQKIELRGTRPDFYVETSRNGTFLVEVESFEEAGPFRIGSRGGAAVDSERIFRRIRTAVQNAARQLRPYKGLGIPMLIALDNWRMVGIPSNISDLRNALFGTLEFRLPIDLGGGKADVEEAHWHHGGGQFFNKREKLYISAVAWNLPKARFVDDPITEVRGGVSRVMMSTSPGPGISGGETPCTTPRQIVDRRWGCSLAIQCRGYTTAW